MKTMTTLWADLRNIHDSLSEHPILLRSLPEKTTEGNREVGPEKAKKKKKHVLKEFGTIKEKQPLSKKQEERSTKPVSPFVRFQYYSCRPSTFKFSILMELVLKSHSGLMLSIEDGSSNSKP